MTLTDEEFVVLKGLQEKFYYFNVSSVDTKEKLLPFMIYKDQAELISRALTEVIEREIDKRREKDKVNSKVEYMLKNQSLSIVNESKCKYELPCGKCDLSKEICTYKYEVTKYGNGI